VGIKHVKSSASVPPLITGTDWDVDHTGGFEPPSPTIGDLLRVPAVVDLALGKTTVADSNRVNEYPTGSPGNVVDGNDATVWSSNSKSIGAAWIYVDLGASQPIGAFRAITEGATNPKRWRGYEIQSSDNASDWVDRYTGPSIWAPDSGITQITPASGRYWRFVNTEQPEWEPALYTFSLYADVDWASLPIGNEGEVLTVAGGVPSWETATGQFTVIWDGGGSVLETDKWVDIVASHAGTITGWTLIADQSGSAVVDIWKDTYANFPPTVADTITASAKPTLSSAVKATSSTLTGWTTAVAAGDILRFNLDSAASVTKLTLVVVYTRTA
jgi:hypothetical protein